MRAEIKVLKHQAEFINSPAIHTALCGGYGAGKSDAAVIKAITYKRKFPIVNVAYYLPTYSLIEDVAIPKFESWLNKIGISYVIHRQFKNIDTQYGKILLRSMDRPERIIGYEVGYSLIDEADILPIDKMKDVFSKIIARNRAKIPEKNKTDVVGTPEGFRWMYQYFVKDAKKNRKIIKARTYDNPFLPDGYVDTLKESYSSEQLEAYLNGEFVNLTAGNVFYSFDRVLNHKNRIAQKTDILYVGIDFNIGNMNAVIHVIDENPIAVDEVAGAYDTQQLCNLLKEKYPDNRIICYPDASGKNRNTNADKTDIDVLKMAGFKVKAPSKNPIILDRVKNANRLMCDSNNERKYFVNVHKCSEYAEALEKQTFDKNGQPDKTSGFDHCTDAGTYFLSYEYPARKFKALW